ncbi:hypothetical protein ABEV00_02295 [Paenibacillus thiaminolyticus]|uniref:hypothetical protein n=1 Tax=Paenibacillus TaxID=44249 RepID=UPI001059307A|nr:hypothetical protein [Paenibacillus dendritiformis]TDL57680.1 hypothetical protein E2R60_04085 [Paenibacillus dendritiformis]
MRIIDIQYPTSLDKIKDIQNDNIDVFVTLEDGMTYTLVVTTPKNYYWYMENEGLDFVPASPPDIIVKELTEENIRKALENFVEGNAYWLKLYFLSGNENGVFEIDKMNEMIARIKKENDEIFG